MSRVFQDELCDALQKFLNLEVGEYQKALVQGADGMYRAGLMEKPRSMLARFWVVDGYFDSSDPIEALKGGVRVIEAMSQRGTHAG